MFKKVVIGGSFDHFHKGHRSFLDYSSSIAGFLIIGVTSDEYLRKNKDGFLEDYETRVRSVSDYLRDKNVRFEIVKIEDVYGKTLEPSFDAEAIIVTLETKKGAEEINRARKEKGLPQLKIKIAKTEFADDHYGISSERIRAGEIDRAGKLFIKPQWLKFDLFITPQVLPDLKIPFGDLIPNPTREILGKIEGKIISVGDESTKLLHELGIKPKISVVDFKVARKKKFSDLSELGFTGKERVWNIKNPAGTLTPELFKAAIRLTEEGMREETVALIDGEDDLSVLPFVLAMPLGGTIFYGQPNEGIVRVSVDEEHKEKAREIVAKFTTRGH